VPNNAVRFEEGRIVVYVRKGEKVDRRPVTTGIRDDSFTEIVSGLSEGDKVIVPVLPMKKVQANPSSPPGVRK